MLCVAVGCAQIMKPLLGFAERAAATTGGNDYAVAAAAVLTLAVLAVLALAVLAGYLVVVSRVFAACAGAAGNR
jgi:hypothetical protein